MFDDVLAEPEAHGPSDPAGADVPANRHDRPEAGRVEWVRPDAVERQAARPQEQAVAGSVTAKLARVGIQRVESCAAPGKSRSPIPPA